MKKSDFVFIDLGLKKNNLGYKLKILKYQNKETKEVNVELSIGRKKLFFFLLVVTFSFFLFQLFCPINSSNVEI